MCENLRKEILLLANKFMNKSDIQMFDICVSKILHKYEISEKSALAVVDNSNEKHIKTYIATLRLEGKAESTIKQYYNAITEMLTDVNKNLCDVTTNDIRFHMSSYQLNHTVSKTTVDNKRRFLSTFFKWLQTEGIIMQNPMLRIKKIKDKYCVKKPFSDEELECLRDNTNNIVDRALIEFLLSTGCRVSEVSSLNINQINFNEGECSVLGKGNKERIVFINNKAMYWLHQYLKQRTDSNEALFINNRMKRMSTETIRMRLNNIAKSANVALVHPHRFRRTMATNLCKRGMSIQYIQKILGHSKIETTLIYCVVDNENVKAAYKKAV